MAVHDGDLIGVARSNEVFAVGLVNGHAVGAAGRDFFDQCARIGIENRQRLVAAVRHQQTVTFGVHFEQVEAALAARNGNWFLGDQRRRHGGSRSVGGARNARRNARQCAARQKRQRQFARLRARVREDLKSRNLSVHRKCFLA